MALMGLMYNVYIMYIGSCRKDLKRETPSDPLESEGVFC